MDPKIKIHDPILEILASRLNLDLDCDRMIL
jgi:hypothetical protein